MPESRLEGDARRAQIVEIARRLFAEAGYRPTTTRQLARAAGVSDALMYRHFTSKDDVLRAVVDQGLVGFIDLAAGGLGAELAARAQAGEVRDDLDGYLFARSFMGSLVAFVLLQRALGMDRVHPIEAEDYLAAQVDLYVRGAQP